MRHFLLFCLYTIRLCSVAIMVITLCVCHSSAQIRLDNWQTFSSMTEIRDIATDRTGNLWVATSGGLFRYVPSTQIFTEFRNINALKSLNVGAVFVHPITNTVYAGGADGMVNMYNGETWSYIGDIVAARLSRPGINDMVSLDSLVFVGGDFGITILNVNRQRFIETTFRMASLPQGTGVRRLLVSRGRLFAATEGGLVSIPLTAPSFANPDAWTLHTTSLTGNSSDQGGMFSLAEMNGIIFAGSQQTIWQLPANASTLSVFQTIDASFRASANNIVTGLTTINNRLVASTAKEIYYFTPTARIATYDESSFLRFNNILSMTGSTQLYASSNSGIIPINGTTVGGAIMPDSPITNQFFNIAVNPTDGSVWSATSIRNTNGRGIMRYTPNDSGSRWTNFTASSFPLGSNNYTRLSITPDDRIFAGAWGDGLAVFTPQNDRYTLQRYTRTNSPLFPFRGTGNFVVIGETRTDDNGTTWITNYGIDSLYALTRDNQFRRFALPRGNVEQTLLAIDGFGTKWVGGFTDATSGLLYFNETITSGSQSGILTSSNSNGAAIDRQNCLVIDKDFVLWIGTNRGLYYTVNPGAVVSGQRPSFSRPPERFENLWNLSINAIAIDATNRKWIGTSGGLFIVTPGADSILAHLTVDNSPLVSNAITSLAVDDEEGIMYIGTANGMNAVQMFAATALPTFAEKIRCYPQPFSPDIDNTVAIDGLAQQASIKISTIDGRLITVIDANSSRRAVWDGRDRTGSLVPGGVYIIGAYTADGSLRAVGKILVKR